MEHYLDNSATTKVCPEAAQAALTAMTEIYGNPSSTHTVGREAKKLLDASRALYQRYTADDPAPPSPTAAPQA